ncbi:hypothetical protein Pmar_PMAR010080 [Perkinsus marinus ATCC 50983]|uniref:Uncharacterized protein n=1 Tax=Perkinsus marinus (strain ATCC 50983 / TXsc) TaxID=423536 RepID=C5K4S3_PERM5|nr:hypothetical protein Pmar_PMAR010080 [Perkinsus marinus ATCC 50983]EER20345.1 hypothetical protein Pmar_PMAR010080 [Perkinsus marinus ATCC 50983]|eukprot:XP_002788549.1 hypothetical protein Pmar_PMAR010080 [Perkinsus marinus ATCC 50983]
MLLIAALLMDSSAVRLQRRGKGGRVAEPKTSLFSKIFNREVISKFKVVSFPLRNFPKPLLDTTVDEIYQKSSKLHFKSCIYAMQLLQKGKYDRVRTIRSEDYYKPPKRPRFFQRLNRMRRSTKLGIKRNGLKRICGLTGKTRDE